MYHKNMGTETTGMLTRLIGYIFSPIDSTYSISHAPSKGTQKNSLFENILEKKAVV